MSTPEAPLERPLIQTTDTHWEGSIRNVIIEHSHPERVRCFCWMVKANGIPFVGGEVIVLPEKGTLVVRIRRGNETVWCQQPTDALRLLDSYGWGEPPDFDLVVRSLSEFVVYQTAGWSEEKAMQRITQSWQELGYQKI